MGVKRFEIRILKDGTMKSHTHGVKGKECLDLLEKLLGEIADIEEVVLTEDYYDDDDARINIDTDVNTDINIGEADDYDNMGV
tara:strand:+ start:129 stop:377 length:249 start_codon:yes stop_codon:yes gene_type:complete